MNGELSAFGLERKINSSVPVIFNDTRHSQLATKAKHARCDFETSTQANGH